MVVGLDAPTIESYPKFIFPGSGLAIIGRQQGHGMCSICLGEYAAGEVLTRMPDCKHCFHAGCVDEWLRMSATFPMCHQWPEPSPVATWLSELIPLAVHARGENVGVWTILLSIFLLVNSYVGYCLHLRWLRQLSNQGVKRTFQCRLHQLNSRSFCVSWLVVTMVPCS